MKKVKGFIADLFGDSLLGTKNTIVSNGNPEFWSTDTEAYIEMGVQRADFVFTGAKINLYNLDDKTLVERNMVKTEKSVEYQMDLDVIAHSGKWQAQVIFINDEDRYATSVFDFEVKRTLNSGAPEKLGIIRDWIVFEGDAKELIAVVEANESTRESNEQVRKSNESQRQANEAIRVDGMMKLENLVSVHTLSTSYSYVEGDELVVSTLTTSHNEIYYSLPHFYGRQYYASVDMKTDSSVDDFRSILTVPLFIHIHPGDDNWHRFSDSFETVNTTGQAIRFLGSYRSGDVSNNPPRIKNPILIDLTSTFGEGNEPSKEAMDFIIDKLGYINGTRLISQQELFGLLMQFYDTKANKKQEEWITPTLSNGWEHVSTGINYRKDSIGNVHIIGRVRGGVDINIFTLPTGYRPSFVYTGQLVSNWKPMIFYIHPNGSVNLQLTPNDDTSIWVAINVTFPGV